MKKTIYFRVDGDEGKFSGLGHIYRSIKIYKYLKKKLNFNYEFIFLSKYGIGKILLKKHTKEKVLNYTNNIFNKLKIYKNDVFIIDTLGAEKFLLKKLNQIKLKKISFDELKTNLFQKGLIINGILFAKKKLKKKKNINIYQGLKYIIINKEYKVKKKVKDIDVNNLTALVCSGGADDRGFLYKISSILNHTKLKKINVVIGKAVNKNNKIFKLKSKKIKKILNITSLKKLIDKSDMIICTGGTIMFEAIACGKKPYIFQNYLHQKSTINYFNKKKVIFNYKKPTYKNIQLLKETLDQFKTEKLINTNLSKANMIDGRGLDRCNKIIYDFIK